MIYSNFFILFILMNLTVNVYSQENCKTKFNSLEISAFQRELLNKNHRSHKYLLDYGNCLTRIQIQHILNKLETKQWNDVQASVAIDLYQQLNEIVKDTSEDSWGGKVNNKIDSVVLNLDRDLYAELGMNKLNRENMSELEKVYIDTNVPWKIAQENQDSIDYYIQKGNMVDFRNYMVRLKNSTQ